MNMLTIVKPRCAKWHAVGVSISLSPSKYATSGPLPCPTTSSTALSLHLQQTPGSPLNADSQYYFRSPCPIRPRRFKVFQTYSLACPQTFPPPGTGPQSRTPLPILIWAPANTFLGSFLEASRGSFMFFMMASTALYRRQTSKCLLMVFPAINIA